MAPGEVFSVNAILASLDYNDAKVIIDGKVESAEIMGSVDEVPEMPSSTAVCSIGRGPSAATLNLREGGVCFLDCEASRGVEGTRSRAYFIVGEKVERSS